MQRLLAKIAYDGTNFCGWQIQPEVRTVQREIETALFDIAKKEVKVVAAGRTDAGVHALGQHIHFDFLQNMSSVQIVKALQTKLSNDVKVVSVVQVKSDFHARYDAYSRSYRYIITREPDPFNRYYKSSFPRSSLNLDIMQVCADQFTGKHDFTSFSKFNPEIKSTLCTISSLEVLQNGSDIIFEIAADRFLHNMVRRIVGTIVNISNSKASSKIITALIKAKSTENKLITTAPPEGLYLEDVKYPEESFIK